MKKTTMQARRPMPQMRRQTKGACAARELTLGDLINAACETLGDERAALRLLRSHVMAQRIGRRLVFL